MNDPIAALEEELTARSTEVERVRLRRGLRQAAQFWRPEDGDWAALRDFARAHFAGDPDARAALLERMRRALESLDGHMTEINRDLRMAMDLDCGPILPLDQTLAGYDPGAHVVDDFFANKLAFSVLLNFPLTSLEEKLSLGRRWTRQEWAQARLADRFGKRIPAHVHLAIGAAGAEAARYVAQYNIWMHHLVDARGARLFPRRMRLLAHWNLRDEIKAGYGDAATGLPRQRMIQKVMERIVAQTIPLAVIDNPEVDWNPFTNDVAPATEKDSEAPASGTREISSAAEPDTRYAKLLATFHASRLADAYAPTAPTLIQRRFEENRQISEARVRRMLEDVLSSPLVSRVARWIETRLGRPLEPFDVWYAGFRPPLAHSEEELDQIVRERYPTPGAYAADIPRLLEKLGFSAERAQYLASNIEVHPARGSGHAFGAGKKGFKAYLRTRVGQEGMNYKGFHIAVHEMGHNVEQIFSLNDIDDFLLSGVPNTAFTEALAFVFQGRDLELLDLSRPDAKTRASKTLADFWGTYEIAGVALVDMGIWHWMYEHANAGPGEVREATLQIARDVWNRFYAPVFHTPDVTLLAIYSHMIDSFLYLPDYPLGHVIAFQIERQMERAGAIGPEFERMAKIGNVTPDLWMEEATGAPLDPEALLSETEKALAQVAP